MAGRVADLVAVVALATVVTVAIALPVLHAPSARMFGMEIVGRHHDPFTVMEQFGRPLSMGVYSQPVTDIAGALLARLTGAVAAYNWLILLSFPLSAAAAYLLARHLALSRAGAIVAAMAYAFSPFHLAHAAYHPHIAQTQWIPLYLLALWRCLDRPSAVAIGCLGAATVAVTLSNFYGGLIAAVITPVAAAAYWFLMCRTETHSRRRLGITLGSLGLIAASGMAYLWYAARAVVMSRAAFAFPRADLFLYSAKWWSYLMPPVEHPLLGPTAHHIWTAANVRQGLLEQQVSLGWGLVTLAVIAVVYWLVRGRQQASLARVPVLLIVAMTALVCSFSPEWTVGTFTVTRPSAWLYDLAPMFRSYARFGVIVQLMTALLAGIGVEYLRRSGTRRARVACIALVVLIIGDYAVSPSAMSRDVLPTAAHRWVVQMNRVKVLDCTPLDRESESVQWLTGSRVMLLGGEINDCTEPNLPEKLVANGYTHLLVRRDAIGEQWFSDVPVPDGLRMAARFDDGQVFTVTANTPAIYTAMMTGFSPRNHDAGWAWRRWMGMDAAWTIVNTGVRPIDATLGLEVLAFARARRMEVRIDGRPVQTLAVEPVRRVYQIGPIAVPPGHHEIVFHPVEAPTVANDVIHNGDPRALSFALGTWHWNVRGEHP